MRNRDSLLNDGSVDSWADFNRNAHKLSMCATLLLTLFTVALVGCGIESAHSSATTGLQGKLTVTGSSTVAPLAAEIAKRFEQLHPNVRVDVQTGGSGKGIADARVGVADIGMASRALKADESDLVAHQIAADGVGLIVHESNSMESLAPEEVIAIYTDQINDWQEVGGQQKEITVVHKAEGRATLEVFLKHFDIENPSVKADVIVGDNEHGVKTVAATQGAVGYVSVGTAEADIEQGVPIRLLPLEGVEASTANVANGRFPMSRPLNLVTSGTPSELALKFIQYCQSPEVHDLVKSQYFVPVDRGPDVSK